MDRFYVKLYSARINGGGNRSDEESRKTYASEIDKAQYPGTVEFLKGAMTTTRSNWAIRLRGPSI